MERVPIKTLDELEFVLFCIESIAERLNKSGKDVYEALAEESNILNTYVVPCYDILHTQGKAYIVDDILEVMSERGVKVERESTYTTDIHPTLHQRKSAGEIGELAENKQISLDEALKIFYQRDN